MIDFQIREIKKEDNSQIESVIRSTFLELNIPQLGTAYEDPETSNMFEAYNANRSIYFVVECDGEVIGGAGIKPLKNYDKDVCELQKMYSAPKMRGLGIGQQLMDRCLEAALSFEFKTCYLETIPMLKTAIDLYKRNGFLEIASSMGSTGHHNCNVWMTKKLK
jgi:putative acetyltransferase